MNLILSLIAGLCFGSFANVCIARLPYDQSIRFPASHCPRCKHPILRRHNVPLWSYIWLRGRCHHCKTPISLQYPLIELIMALLFIFSACWFRDAPTRMVIFDITAFYLLTISIIDYHHRIIPDELSLSLLAIGLLTSYANPFLPAQGWANMGHSFTAALGGGGLMLLLAWAGEKIFKKEALGGGDVKLVAAFGALMGWGGLFGALTLGSFAGALAGGALLLSRRKKPGDAIPYGPFLCFGAFLTLLSPEWVRGLIFP